MDSCRVISCCVGVEKQNDIEVCRNKSCSVDDEYEIEYNDVTIEYEDEEVEYEVDEVEYEDVTIEYEDEEVEYKDVTFEYECRYCNAVCAEIDELCCF